MDKGDIGIMIGLAGILLTAVLFGIGVIITLVVAQLQSKNERRKQ